MSTAISHDIPGGAFLARLARDQRRVVILDDDPTGTQTASGVGVILRPDVEAFRHFLATGERGVYVITNTRALEPSAAVALLRDVRAAAGEAAREAGMTLAYVLRGDSTLRGHAFAEMEELGLAGAAGLVVPAFPAAGRVTLGGVHYLEVDGQRVPVSQTEFARDPVFGYRATTMTEWVRELGGERPVTLVPLERLRGEGAGAVAAALLAIPDGGVVVPDVETDGDVELIVGGLLDAEERGRPVVVRSAAPLASIRAGLRGLLHERVLPAGSRVLTVCGSHTAAATRQLAALAELVEPELITLPTDRLLGGARQCERAVEAAVARAGVDLDTYGIAIVSSERVRRAGHGQLWHGARVMDAMVRTARALAPSVDGLISKGGITSADMTARALGAASARVLGQVLTGVPLWQVPREGGGGTIPVAVVPGNVGDDRALCAVAERFGVVRTSNRESDTS